jgi:hypothetical protein
MPSSKTYGTVGFFKNHIAIDMEPNLPDRQTHKNKSSIGR